MRRVDNARGVPSDGCSCGECPVLVVLGVTISLGATLLVALGLAARHPAASILRDRNPSDGLDGSPNPILTDAMLAQSDQVRPALSTCLHVP